MKLNDAASDALETIGAIAGELSEKDRDRIREAVEVAMRKAVSVCSDENVSVVSEHLAYDRTLMDRINVETEMRRKALISNLSAAG